MNWCTVVRFVGKGREKRQVNDAVYYECPECGKLVYDEPLPNLEFEVYLGKDDNLVCEGCYDRSGVNISRTNCFIFNVVITSYVPQPRQVPIAAQIIREGTTFNRWGVKIVEGEGVSQ